ncbi:MAG: hypothetical protein JGK01_11360 [Microcoleus sp. PH2017_03_ELD_O_A]|nr:hypothetical protein [Microcoleus sp. PH2017_03_ELD_O_A]
MRQSLLVPHLKIRLIADAPYNIASDRSYCQLSTVNCQLSKSSQTPSFF